MYGLTPVQAHCFDFLRHHKDETGVYPSLREIAEHLELRSVGRVHEILTGLEDRGVIKRLDRKARAIEIVEPHEARTVLVGESVWPLLVRYAIAEKMTLEEATNQLIRDGIEGA